MGAINCNVTCCDLLSIANSLVDQRKYGMECNGINYCDIIGHYLRYNGCPTLIDSSIASIEDKVTTILSVEFQNHICATLLDTEVEQEPEVYWIGIDPFCEINQDDENTGFKTFATLEAYFAENDEPTGETKPNDSEDEDYIAPAQDFAFCPLTYHIGQDYNFAFDSSSDGLISLLTVGNLVAAGHTIGDYLIEWHVGSVGGALALTSGNGVYPSIQATHPFINEPVQGGELYPVIKRVMVDGTLYTSTYEPGVLYSPDLEDCLSSITVLTLNCSNGTLVNQTYSHIMTYNNTVDLAQDASRIFKFDLNTDGTTKYFAWMFTGYTVADRISIFYVKYNDTDNPILLDDWVIGTNLNITNYTSSPKRFGSGQQTLRFVTNLADITHDSGDYLLIQISPRYYEPLNTNTNWDFQFRCLITFTPPTELAGFNEIDTDNVTMVYDSVNCLYNLTIHTQADYIYSTSDFGKYLSYSHDFGYSMSYGTSSATIALADRTSGIWANLLYSVTCQAMTNSATISKVGNLISLVFLDTADYNLFKNAYNTILTHPNFSNYTPDNTLVNHYKCFRLRYKAGTLCGDAGTLTELFIHLSSVFTFTDATKTINITLNNITNGLPVITCNTSRNAVDSYMLPELNNTINLANFSTIFSLTTSPPVSGMFLYTTLSKTTAVYLGLGRVLHPVLLNNLVDLTGSAWYLDTDGNYKIYSFFLYAQITDEADWINNFRIKNGLDAEYKRIPVLANYTDLYEIEDGVVIIP